MALLNRALLPTYAPVVLAKRFRGKINIQKPRPPHFKKQLLIDFTKPFYGIPKYKLPDIELCRPEKKKIKAQIDNPFERILARECLDWFNTSKMVVVLHMNSISMEEKTPIFAALRKNDMHLRTYGKKIVSMATVGTRYEVINKLFVSQQNLIFGQPDKAPTMFKILKKAPQMVVMAGIIENKLMSRNELLEFSQLPSLDVARSKLCSVLQNAGSSLVMQLNQAQQMLVSHLDKHVELQKTSVEEKPKSDS